MLIDKHKVRYSFGGAALTYDAAAVVQKEILERLIERVSGLVGSVNSVLDLGSGTGMAISPLQNLLKPETYCAMDFALPMLQQAQIISSDNFESICADAEHLPFTKNSFDLIFSASTLQWCNDVQSVYRDCFRVLKPGGLFIFSTFGPDTLRELRACFAQIDSSEHVNTFVDMHILGDCLVEQRYADTVMESEKLQIHYNQPLQLLRDLKATGATNNLTNASKGLFSKKAFDALFTAYEAYRLENAKYPATYEVIYGHARKAQITESRNTDPDQWAPIQFR